MWKWKNREIGKADGVSWTGGYTLVKNITEGFRVCNRNADVLKEAVEKIDELHREIENLKRKESV